MRFLAPALLLSLLIITSCQGLNMPTWPAPESEPDADIEPIPCAPRPPDCDEPIELREWRLDRAIRDALGQPDGVTLYYEDVCRLETLKVSEARVGSLQGMQCLTGLRSLTLYETEIIEGIYALAGLVRLEQLNLFNNNIVSVSSLASLTNLRELTLSWNPIQDITPLVGLTRLETLYLFGNDIEDITPLSNLTALTELSIGLNRISDIEPLSGLHMLEHLGLTGNAISDLEPIRGLTNLTELNIVNNQIADLGPLTGLVQITELYAQTNQIEDPRPLSGLVKLERLLLDNNALSSLEPIKALIALSDLSLKNTNTSKLDTLALSPGLDSGDTLKLRDNPIRCPEQANNIAALRDRGVNVEIECP